MNSVFKYEKFLYVEIFFTIIVVMLSIPIWFKNGTYKELMKASKYDNYNYIEYEFLNNPTYVSSPVSDEYAINNIETQNLIVYNGTKSNDKYSVVLKISKNSTANKDNIKLNVNNEIKYLNNFNYYEDKENYYYILDSKYLSASMKEYALAIWNDENAVVDDSYVLNYEFMVI